MFLCWLKALGIHSCGWWGVIYTYGRYRLCKYSSLNGLIWKTQKLYSWKTPIVGGSGGYRWIYLTTTYARNSRAWRGGEKCSHSVAVWQRRFRGGPTVAPHSQPRKQHTLPIISMAEFVLIARSLFIHVFSKFIFSIIVINLSIGLRTAFLNLKANLHH